MKKSTVLLALLLSLCLLSGCGVQAFLHDTAEQLRSANAQIDGAPEEEPDSPSDLPTGGEPVTPPEQDAPPVSASDAEETAAPTEPPAAEQGGALSDLTALSLAECVTDADGAAGQLPRIVPDCPGADSINEDIEGTFRYLVDADYCTLYYDASKNGSILSVMIAQLYDGDSAYYTPYLLDLSTGQRMNGSDLLGRMNLSEGDIAAAELRIMGEEFEYQYGRESQGEASALYQEQLQRTVSEDNADLDRLWLDSQGQLYFVARIYSLAGAEFYEYPMGTGYYFG